MQCYTLLNKAPEYSYRFYGRISPNVNGGMGLVENPKRQLLVKMIDIHHKVLSLKFSKCHTKICNMDVHETL